MNEPNQSTDTVRKRQNSSNGYISQYRFWIFNYGSFESALGLFGFGLFWQHSAACHHSNKIMCQFSIYCVKWMIWNVSKHPKCVHLLQFNSIAVRRKPLPVSLSFDVNNIRFFFFPIFILFSHQASIHSVLVLRKKKIEERTNNNCWNCVAALFNSIFRFVECTFQMNSPWRTATQCVICTSCAIFNCIICCCPWKCAAI